MKPVLHESQVFGPLNVFNYYLNQDIIYIEKHEHYQKRSYRNRYSVLTANGIITLSIPLKKGKNAGIPISEVCISYDENWVDKHLHCLRSAYGSSPYFEFYYYDIEHILKKKHSSLFQLNLETIEFAVNKLKLSLKICFTQSYQTNYPEWTDLRNNDWKSYQSSLKYPQVWENKFNFVPNLSILDLLFCTGPEAVSYLTKMYGHQQHQINFE